MNGRFILALLLALPLLSQTRESRRPADRRIQISAAGASGGSCSAALPRCAIVHDRRELAPETGKRAERRSGHYNRHARS